MHHAQVAVHRPRGVEQVCPAACGVQGAGDLLAHVGGLARPRDGDPPGAVIDEVHDLKEEVVITKRGKPMAKLIPVKKQKDDIFGFMRGQGRIVGDIISPIDPTDKWDSEK